MLILIHILIPQLQIVSLCNSVLHYSNVCKLFSFKAVLPLSERTSDWLPVANRRFESSCTHSWEHEMSILRISSFPGISDSQL